MLWGQKVTFLEQNSHFPYGISLDNADIPKIVILSRHLSRVGLDMDFPTPNSLLWALAVAQCFHFPHVRKEIVRKPAPNSSPPSCLSPSTLLWCPRLSYLDVYTVVLRCVQPGSRASLIWHRYKVFLEEMLVIYFLSFSSQLSHNTDWNFDRFVRLYWIKNSRSIVLPCLKNVPVTILTSLSYHWLQGGWTVMWGAVGWRRALLKLKTESEPPSSCATRDAWRHTVLSAV